MLLNWSIWALGWTKMVTWPTLMSKIWICVNGVNDCSRASGNDDSTTDPCRGTHGSGSLRDRLDDVVLLQRHRYFLSAILPRCPPKCPSCSGNRPDNNCSIQLHGRLIRFADVNRDPTPELGTSVPANLNNTTTHSRRRKREPEHHTM